MTNLLKTRAVVALVPVALILAACAQQPAPEAHAAPVGSSGMMEMQSGAGNQMSGMSGMMQGGGQMADMNKMMMQMSQMMDRCNAMMQHGTMHSPGAGDGSHPQ